MDAAAALLHTGVPLPQHQGSETMDGGASLVPIHIVNHVSQLPIEFLEPSTERQLVIGFDCEGVDLCRNGALCIMQLAFPDAVYLVDVIQGGETLMEACKPALESSYITKVIHDCKRDSEALFFQFGIKLNNVLDTQIAYSLIEEQEGKKRTPDDYISFVSLLADPRYCGMPYLEKEEVRVLLRQDPTFWAKRPMSDLMIHTATDDVCFLLYIYYKMIEKLTEKSLFHLAVRGSFYCRCFCFCENNEFTDWPSVPPLPADHRPPPCRRRSATETAPHRRRSATHSRPSPPPASIRRSLQTGHHPSPILPIDGQPFIRCRDSNWRCQGSTGQGIHHWPSKAGEES